MNLEQIKKKVVNEFIDLGLEASAVEFKPAADCVNLMCEIVVTDKSGTVVEGHIYRSFDKNLKETFIARYYED